MHISFLLALPLLCLAQTSSPVLSSAQASGLATLTQFLVGSGLTDFVDAVDRIRDTPVGSQFVSELAQAATGNKSQTFFVPNNNAFTGSPPKNITDLNILAGIFTYHLIEGEFTIKNIPSPPNFEVVLTSMNISELVQLEGNKYQVLNLINANGTITVTGQNTPVTVVSQLSLPSNITNPNLKAYVLSAVLDPPPPLSDVFPSTNLSVFEAAATNISYIDALESGRGITIFAPTDEAATKFFANHSFDTSTMAALLGNHVINGSTVYYLDSNPLNEISASGEPLTISTNHSGAFVTSGSTTAAIIQYNVLTKNGVVHVIDRVLFDTATNKTAANAAYSSALSAANTAVVVERTQTSPVGIFTGFPALAVSHPNHALNLRISLGCVVSSLLFLIISWAIVF